MKKGLFFKILISSIFLIGFTLPALGETQGVSKDEIVLGSHSVLSGPIAGFGIPSMNGVRLRFEEANEKGGIHGRKIKFIVEDSQYRIPIAIQKVNKLINRDKVFAIVGAFGTPINSAVFKLQEAKNIPNLFPFSFAKSMVEPLHKLKFAIAPSYYDQVRGGLKYFIEEKGKKNICAMCQDSEYGKEAMEGIMAQLAYHNMKLIASTSHKLSETSFVNPITKLKKAGCDLIVMGTVIRDTIIPVSTARKMGWDVDFMGLTSSMSDMIPQMGKGAVEGFYAASGIETIYEDMATDPRAIAFFKNYQKRYNKPAHDIALPGYLLADIVVLALEKAGRDLTLDSFLTALESTDNYKSMFGGADRSISPTKHTASLKTQLLWIKDGRFVSPSSDGKKIELKH